MFATFFNFTAPIHARKRKVFILAVLTFIALC